MDASAMYNSLKTKQEDIELLSTTSVIDSKEMIVCKKSVDKEEIPLIQTKPGEISKPLKIEEIALIAQSPNMTKLDRESQVKEEDSLPPTRVNETKEIERSKPAEDEETALIVQATNVNEVDQESQSKEDISEPPQEWLRPRE